MGTIHLNRNGVTYVYSSQSFWDKDAKKHRSKRKLIGKIDPVTGELVPTRKYVRKKKDEVPAAEKQAEEPAPMTESDVAREDELRKLASINESLQEENRKLKEKLGIYEEAMKKASDSFASVIGGREP